MQPVGIFCAPVESVGKAVEAVGKPVEYPSVRRWILPFQRKTVSVRFRVRGHKYQVSYLLYVNLDILLQIVSIEVQDQVMNIVKPITNNDEWQLICQLGFLNTRKQNKEKEKLVERGEKKNRRLGEKMKELP